MKTVLNALQFRHACKKFNHKKKIPAENLMEVLECARLSPSSFGMEPWKFLVIKDSRLRESLKSACWNQPQITDSSDLIVILDKKDQTKPGSDYVKQQFRRRELDTAAEQAYLQRYQQHYQAEISPNMNNYAWDSKQCYIALSNIMTAAASMGIDSCPIEGFEKRLVEQALELDTEKFEVVVLVTLGYRAKEQPPRLRLTFDEVVEFIE